MTDKRPSQTRTYVSIVVETDGPIPGPYSLRGLGAVALTREGKPFSSFETFFSRLPGSQMHPDNAKYWTRDQNAQTYARMEHLGQDPIDAISHLVSWTNNLPGKPILAAYNASHTWMWTHWYCTNYADKSPFTLGPLDIKSHMAPFLRNDFLNLTKADLPDAWRKEMPKPDTVVQKAEKQAFILQSLINAKSELSSTIDLPTWTRTVFGPSVRESKKSLKKSRQKPSRRPDRMAQA